VAPKIFTGGGGHLSDKDRFRKSLRGKRPGTGHPTQKTLGGTASFSKEGPTRGPQGTKIYAIGEKRQNGDRVRGWGGPNLRGGIRWFPKSGKIFSPMGRWYQTGDLDHRPIRMRRKWHHEGERKVKKDFRRKSPNRPGSSWGVIKTKAERFRLAEKNLGGGTKRD